MNRASTHCWVNLVITTEETRPFKQFFNSSHYILHSTPFRKYFIHSFWKRETEEENS